MHSIKATDIRTLVNETVLPRYSICTLLTDKALYQQMLESFAKAGFTPDITEYLYLDNSITNVADGYSGVNEFLTMAKGRYIIICHQDIVLINDNLAHLENCIAELNKLDPKWALLGNAGGQSLGCLSLRVTDSHGNNNTGGFPMKVQSLDENFILVRKDANLGASSDLDGFHLYGFDLCFMAAMRGYSAYVVDFRLQHLSPGKISQDFINCRSRIIGKYQQLFSGRFFQTTCTSFYLSGNAMLNSIFNYQPIIKWLEDVYRRFGWS